MCGTQQNFHFSFSGLQTFGKDEEIKYELNSLKCYEKKDVYGKIGLFVTMNNDAVGALGSKPKLLRSQNLWNIVIFN